MSDSGSSRRGTRPQDEVVPLRIEDVSAPVNEIARVVPGRRPVVLGGLRRQPVFSVGNMLDVAETGDRRCFLGLVHLAVRYSHHPDRCLYMDLIEQLIAALSGRENAEQVRRAIARLTPRSKTGVSHAKREAMKQTIARLFADD